MSEIEMIEVDAVEYRRVMAENKALKKDVAGLRRVIGGLLDDKDSAAVLLADGDIASAMTHLIDCR